MLRIKLRLLRLLKSYRYIKEFYDEVCRLKDVRIDVWVNGIHEFAFLSHVNAHHASDVV